MEWIAQYWPFGTSTLGLILGGFVALVVIRFVAGLVVRLVTLGAVALGVGFWFFPSYMPFELPFLAASSQPKWVLVSSAGSADGIDVAYSVSDEPKAKIKDLPVCDEANIGKVAVCGTPGFGVVAGMVASGLPTDLSMTSIPTGVCSYKMVASTEYLYEGGETKVYECKR
jgi:hypothetical protein